MRNLEVYEESLMENYLNSNYNYVGVEEKTGEMRICPNTCKRLSYRLLA